MRWLTLDKMLRGIAPLTLAAIASVSLGGCDDGELQDVSIRPGWVANQEFYLESRYNRIEMNTERGDAAFDLEAYLAGEPGNESTMDLDDSWSEPVYWRYQVIEQGLTPAEGEDFHEFYAMGTTPSPLTVIKASLDPQLNLDSELFEINPKVYMVVRENRLRMAGLVYFYTDAHGERQSEAIVGDAEEIGRSFNRLSQANHSLIPNYIPPFPIAAMDREMVLEDGQLASFSNATDSAVDVVYENSMDGSLIAETWEDGQPWALESYSSNVESRLLEPGEVAELQRGLPAWFDEGDEEDDRTYVERLKAPMRLTDAFFITDDMVGTTSYEVDSGYKPWAGSWWPQSRAALVFGYLSGSQNTISQLAKDTFTPLGVDIQNLGDELRDLRKNGEGNSDAYREKADEYRDTQKEFVDALVGFYNKVRQAIDGGQIRVDGDYGVLVLEENWNQDSENPQPEMELSINRLSPFDKWALVEQIEGNTHGSNPWFVPAWELLNHWSPSGASHASWWGHCNGWSAASILLNEPREARDTQHSWQGEDLDVRWTTADLKGIVTEANYSTQSHFFGSRYNDEDDNLADLTPPSVLKILNTYIRDRHVPLVFDITAESPVWNYPAWRYTLELNETTEGRDNGAASGLININTAGVTELSTLWGISNTRAQRVIAYREANGPFQTIEEIIDVSGIGRGIFNRIQDQITVDESTDLRTFDGVFKVQHTTDGVYETHVDSNPEMPEGFVDEWEFTMTASPSGEILSGQWDDDKNHPDFAWVPYLNTDRAGSSENPFIRWRDFTDQFPGMLRE